MNNELSTNRSFIELNGIYRQINTSVQLRKYVLSSGFPERLTISGGPGIWAQAKDIPPDNLILISNLTMK